jgi:LPXTG-site transpeptidase (sortase) family protein
MDVGMNGLRAQLSARAQQLREWFSRLGILRFVLPGGLLAGIVLVVVGFVLLTSGGGGGDRPDTWQEDLAQSDNPYNAVPGTAYEVPPHLVEAMSFLVPARQVYAGFNLKIDELGVDARVVKLDLTPDRTPQVPNSANTIAWYEFTSMPGEGSNAVLAGHVRWAGERGVLADLKDLDDGDEIRITFSDGSEAVYEVERVFDVDADLKGSLKVMDPTPDDTLTIITCGGTFEANSDNPLGGEFTERTVVKAKLVNAAVSSS